jgi:hypothetical protein
LYSYKESFEDVGWVPPGGIATSGADTCSDNLALPAAALTHPIVTFPSPDLTTSYFVPVSCGIHGSFTGVPASYDVIAVSNDTTNPVMIASNGSPGRVLIRGHQCWDTRRRKGEQQGIQTSAYTTAPHLDSTIRREDPAPLGRAGDGRP